jgi:cyclic pyranopterin phosphate synthase
MPEEGVQQLSHSEILSFEEIEEVVKTAVACGIDKVRLTGGEPLVRKGIVNLVEHIAAIPGIKDLALTTNGTLLEQFAEKLAAAGLKRINISLDTVDPDKFKEITRGGDIKHVIRGIVAARKAGLTPIKINCVIDSTSEDPDALGVRTFCENMGLEVRFIHRMSLHKGTFSVVQGGSGGDCVNCNRLRLTANGKIKPCLFNDLEYDVRILGAAEAIRLAIQHKPECGTINNSGAFYNIGG